MNWEQPYNAARSPVCADNLVATSQPLAVQAGLHALRRGGNAVDAALATAITLTVVEPVNNGLGSDAFALVWDADRLIGLNASGRAPRAMTRERFGSASQMPSLGWDAVTVPESLTPGIMTMGPQAVVGRRSTSRRSKAGRMGPMTRFFGRLGR